MNPLLSKAARALASAFTPASAIFVLVAIRFYLFDLKTHGVVFIALDDPALFYSTAFVLLDVDVQADGRLRRSHVHDGPFHVHAARIHRDRSALNAFGYDSLFRF